MTNSRHSTSSPTSVLDELSTSGHCNQYNRGPPRTLQKISQSLTLVNGGACYPVPSSSPKKYKTEMCKNLIESGYCRFGANCHYAHGEEERRAASAEDLARDDRLLWPCSIMVSTGFW